MWNRMTDQEFNTLLIEAIKNHGPKLGIAPVAKLTIKALKTCTAEGSVPATEPDPFLQARNSLIECGKVLFEDRDLSRIEGIVFSGAVNLNPTIVVMVVEDTTIRINAYAKEGLVNQHTAQRAMKKITELLESK